MAILNRPNQELNRPTEATTAEDFLKSFIESEAARQNGIDYKQYKEIIRGVPEAIAKLVIDDERTIRGNTDRLQLRNRHVGARAIVGCGGNPVVALHTWGRVLSPVHGAANVFFNNGLSGENLACENNAPYVGVKEYLPRQFGNDPDHLNGFLNVAARAVNRFWTWR